MSNCCGVYNILKKKKKLLIYYVYEFTTVHMRGLTRSVVRKTFFSIVRKRYSVVVYVSVGLFKIEICPIALSKTFDKINHRDSYRSIALIPSIDIAIGAFWENNGRVENLPDTRWTIGMMHAVIMITLMRTHSLRMSSVASDEVYGNERSAFFHVQVGYFKRVRIEPRVSCAKGVNNVILCLMSAGVFSSRNITNHSVRFLLLIDSCVAMPSLAAIKSTINFRPSVKPVFVYRVHCRYCSPWPFKPRLFNWSAI